MIRHQNGGHRHHHHDPYYSPTSLVGMVRAERVKYLRNVTDHRSLHEWEMAERVDPSRSTVVDPDHEAEGAQLLLGYYEAVRRDRHVRLAAIAIALLGVGGLSALVGWLLSNLLVGAGGVALGFCVAYWILDGTIVLPRKADAAMTSLRTSGFFRNSEPLNGYLITTRDPAAIWEAIDLEGRRQSLDAEAARLRAHSYLPTHRQTEIAQLQEQEQELRQRIVDMLDPQTPADRQLEQTPPTAYSRAEEQR